MDIRYERRGLVAGSQRRPGDVSAREAAQTAGAAALSAEAAKVRNAPCLGPGVRSVPFAVDGLGYVAPAAQSLRNALASRAVRTGGLAAGEGDETAAKGRVLTAWRRRLSAAVHGSIARVVLRRTSRARHLGAPADSALDL